MHIGIRAVAPAVGLLGLLGLLFAACAPLAAADRWGTPLKPFSAQSPWNARPVAPVLGDFEIPRSSYYPELSEGKWSTGVFAASAADAATEVLPLPGRPGVWDPDAEAPVPRIVVAHWPDSVLPASGIDGHADIVDPTTGIVHSFYQLKHVDGRWRAGQYAWTRLDGRGWGDPAHYFQGARAAAVPTMAGIIRRHEVDDGDVVYRHALAMSLTFNALSANPAYVYPATSADGDAARTNTGRIPEGALLMLPPDYDTGRIRSPKLRKVAETLKRYGGYVVDRNVGTPFAIYVENGSNLNLHGRGGWSNHVAEDLDRIRAALRQVVSTRGWLDGDDRPMRMPRRLNLLSMRGPWRVETPGADPGAFDTRRQAVTFAATRDPVTQVNASGRGLASVAWAKPAAGHRYKLTAHADGGARLRLRLTGGTDAGSATLYDSGELQDGRAVEFKWPARQTGVVVTVRSGGLGRPSSVGATLVETGPAADDGGP